jgi:hypothetical protein
MSEELDKLDQYKSDVSKDYEATEYQRLKANEDMRFCSVDGGQWENWLTHTHGVNAARAKLELDVVSDYVQGYIGEYMKNRANVTFTASDDATTDDDAELINGLYRADFRDNDGSIAQDNAVSEMAYCGVGAYLVRAKFEDDEDPENENQKICFDPIYNAFNHVMWSANAKRIDKADANHCTVLYGYTPDAFKAEFEEASPVSAYAPERYSYVFQRIP